MRSVDKSDWVFMLIGFLSRVIESRIVTRWTAQLLTQLTEL